MTSLHFLKKNGYVDGWAVNIWHVFIQVSKKRNKNISHVDGSAVNIWQLSNISYVDGWAINIWLVYIFISWNTNILKQKHVICWRLSRQHNCSFWKVQTCHMLTAQPSTYHMFGLIELYGRKLQSVCPKKCGDKLPSHCMQGEEDWSKHFTLSIVLSFNLCIQSFLAFHLFSRWISYDFSRKFGACFQWDITLLCLNFGCIWVDIWHTNFTIPRYVFPGT